MKKEKKKKGRFDIGVRRDYSNSTRYRVRALPLGGRGIIYLNAMSYLLLGGMNREYIRSLDF